MSEIKVKDAPGYVRKDGIALLNTDKAALELYKKSKHRAQVINTWEQKYKTLEARVVALEEKLKDK